MNGERNKTEMLRVTQVWLDAKAGKCQRYNAADIVELAKFFRYQGVLFGLALGAGLSLLIVVMSNGS